MMGKYYEGMVIQVYIYSLLLQFSFFKNNVIAIIYCQQAWTWISTKLAKYAL